MFGLPYSSPHWPKGADREYYLARARKYHLAATDAQIESVAAASAMIDRGSKAFVARAATFDGERVSEATAAEIRQLGRKASGLRFAA